MSRILLLIVLSLFLAGCQSTSDDSEQTKTTNPKKVGDDPESGGLFSSVINKSSPKTIALPPDLISKANSKVKENHELGEQERNSQRVLPEIAGTRMMSTDDGTKWLQVETDAQTVWDTLANFWAAEQIDLVEYQPAAGLMETDWIASDRPTEGNKPSVWASMFNRVVGKGTSFDKFKVRLDRDGDNLTNIYVTHRSTARKESNFVSQMRVTEWEWVEGDSDQEKVAQLLQVMVLLFENSAQEPA
jgi:uncharacterized lipoprotein